MEAEDGVVTQVRGVKSAEFALYPYIDDPCQDLGGMGVREQHERPKDGQTFAEVFKRHGLTRKGLIDVEPEDPMNKNRTSFATVIQDLLHKKGVQWSPDDDFLSGPKVPPGVSPHKVTGYVKQDGHFTLDHAEWIGAVAANLLGLLFPHLTAGYVTNSLSGLGLKTDEEVLQILRAEDKRAAQAKGKKTLRDEEYDALYEEFGALWWAPDLTTYEAARRLEEVLELCFGGLFTEACTQRWLDETVPADVQERLKSWTPLRRFCFVRDGSVTLPPQFYLDHGIKIHIM
ncbi:hypothetical protein KFL_006230060 [Klebsormidium nitens]|uniref:Uncharacterized protein n=1 Tax=Klebsormidium nitens TaxID=105231 RepID=A0A1Y1INV3_KLENI|nr:hypothetical protein KFL_006230060 [Klebsormidium nitens]|eukprot:GAQ90297.1 hypothetical protein KFL_006230060 [Klebsormidium nitens]